MTVTNLLTVSVLLNMQKIQVRATMPRGRGDGGAGAAAGSGGRGGRGVSHLVFGEEIKARDSKYFLPHPCVVD